MNFTESFDSFSKSITPTDIMVYAGIGIIVWVLVKDKLPTTPNPLQNIVNKIKELFNSYNLSNKAISPKPLPQQVIVSEEEDTFYKLIASWKETRDLAVKSGCEQAVKVADQMFPYLSPNVCNTENKGGTNVEVK
jgi:hypothetical protein